MGSLGSLGLLYPAALYFLALVPAGAVAVSTDEATTPYT